MFPHPDPPFHTDWWSIDRLFPILLMLLLLSVVIWAVVRLTRQPTAMPAGTADPWPRSPSVSTSPDPALEHVRLRYSRGEVDRETFLQIVGDLTPGGVEGAADDPPPSVTP
jgi:uncharacterized membrane protein